MVADSEEEQPMEEVKEEEELSQEQAEQGEELTEEQAEQGEGPPQEQAEEDEVPNQEEAEEEELEEEVSAEDACSAARALSISLKELTLRPQDEWLPAIHNQMKKLQVLTHPDQGGSPDRPRGLPHCPG